MKSGSDFSTSPTIFQQIRPQDQNMIRDTDDIRYTIQGTDSVQNTGNMIHDRDDV